MRISDWSSDVCSSDLKNSSVSLTKEAGGNGLTRIALGVGWDMAAATGFFAKLSGGNDSIDLDASCLAFDASGNVVDVVWFRSEEHTSELQSLMRISYAVFCLKKKKQ